MTIKTIIVLCLLLENIDTLRMEERWKRRERELGRDLERKEEREEERERDG